ncbi:MAG: sulfurtransferase TusA family protein [Microcystaceae cyanobacterium]
MSQTESVLLDLRGTPCPINFVRTKLKLSQMAIGETLEVWLDGGEPIEQVPHSLEVAGYTEQNLVQVENYFKLSIHVNQEG